MRSLALVVLTACGRLAFDPLDDAGTSGSGPIGEASPGDGMADAADAELLLHLAFESDGLLVDRARGHAASCHGTCPPMTTGRIGATAVDFSGTQCIEIADAADLRPASFTTSLWANVDAPAADGEMFSRPRNGETTSNNVMELFSGANGNWTLIVGGATIGRPVAAGAWHHAALVVDAGTLTVYIDGSAMGSMPTGALGYATDPYLIGCERDNNVDVFRLRGSVDDVRMYGRALAPAEIAALAAM